MVFEEIKIAYLKRKLLLEEKKKSKREGFRKKKEALQLKANKTKDLEQELRRRIAVEKKRGLSESDKKRIVARKKLIERRKTEVKNGLKSIIKEGKDFFIFIGNKMDEAEKKKQLAIKKQKKNRTKKKRQSKKR